MFNKYSEFYLSNGKFELIKLFFMKQKLYSNKNFLF